MKTDADTAIVPIPLPPSLEAAAEQRIEAFCQRHDDAGRWLARQLDADADFAQQLRRAWSCSPFIYDICFTWPEVLTDLVASGDLVASYGDEGYNLRLATRLAGVDDEKVLHRVLRQFRRREMVRVVWRDFNRLAPLLETTGDVTRLAEACIQHAMAALYPQVVRQMGTPMGAESGEPQHMVVLGMGKMGAWELNVSSDIDLIFTFPEAGNTEGARRQYSNQEFFLRLAQKLIQALDNTTVDGFVFRVDMRLRPYGESGALVLNFDAMEEYYQTQGRDWERYAMIKARVVAGNSSDGDALMAILRPFTYRKYIDFSAIQSLRDMKSLINREVARLGIVDDVKKSAGGIREVEFIAQAFQLIRGGKDQRFQNPSLKHVLALLDDGMLPPGEAGKLWGAYVFLRNAEHVLQGYRDKQTQRLPGDSEEQEIVATAMGFHCWEDFYSALDGHRAAVKEIYAGIAAESPEEEQRQPVNQQVKALWIGSGGRDDYVAEVDALGFAEAEQIGAQLHALRGSRSVKALTATVRSRLDNFIPLLLTLCLESKNGHIALQRILPLVEGILRRSAYMVLMLENPGALRQLVYLCTGSQWIAEQIRRYPALLDELLDSRTLFTPQDKEAIRQDLRQSMLRIPGDDLEALMEGLRYFRRAQALRIAACEVAGALPLMKVSDNLTWLAEVILEQVLAIAWDWMVGRHGRPGRGDDEPPPGLAVIGYGKLGGLELGHSSDLDLVFLHNASPGHYTDGDKRIDNQTFFMRLCQRMIHILSTQTASGDLYEVDARLRPNGNSGMLVTSVAAFEKYQREDAWTWEHQALVRARAVAGDPAIAAEFDAIRRRILARPRDTAELRRDVVEMREKMRAHLGTSSRDDRFHLKQDAGGLVDIEFLVQYLVLARASDHPALLQYTDNMRILDRVRDSGLLPEGTVTELQETFVGYRTLGHRLSLQGASSVLEGEAAAQLADSRELVTAIWRQQMLDEPET